MRKKVWLFALAAVLLVILAGCRGNELPDGMDEDKVSSAGLAVMSQLTKSEYEEVYDALREDVREQTRDGRRRAACHRCHRREIRQKVRGVPHRVRYGDEPYRTGCEREVSR